MYPKYFLIANNSSDVKLIGKIKSDRLDSFASLELFVTKKYSQKEKMMLPSTLRLFFKAQDVRVCILTISHS